MASFFLERIRSNAVNDATAQAKWSEKKMVWITDKTEGYLQASIVSENGDELEVQLEDNTKRKVNINDTEKMNPPKFDLVEDMAELTHLNEASVVHNLKLRYVSNLIYTYSGLFCVAVNPYKKLPIYSDEFIRSYKGKKRSEMPPHIYCIVDQAYNDMLNNRENQSILITGESGAGKTENTKKVIQYLAASSKSGQPGDLEKQILQANPLLEAFGNAQTIRNNNSSRFGKFIRLEFSSSGQITGANIERYLLEKSRVTHQTNVERNYHIFYQLLSGGSKELKNGTAADYRFVSKSKHFIDGVDDVVEFKALKDSLKILQFSEDDQTELFRVISSILHLGNITLEKDREENASLTAQCASVVEKVCHVLGIPVAEFGRSLVKPRIKAGRDWVTQAKTVEQVYYSIEALARSLYERMFGDIVDRINKNLYTPGQKQSFIGVLDIAGFEIFDKNSFEQLCINYTNERLQQFFNHHMFILEQEEYQREGIEWKFIDFGLDLQPTIELIEKSNPIGILSLLDEECVMPKASDKTFVDKLSGLWKGKSTKYDVPRFNSGFILTHYAGKVEYNVDGWLDKNKDPLNENITKLLANSTFKYIANLFSDSLGEEVQPTAGRTVGITKKGAFRTVAQKHRESLTSLMTQLYSTQPNFVRCIIPNEEKRPGKVDLISVLEQLRCNGVLEGIRICRAGFPNRLIFQDFRSRYEVLGVGVIPKGYVDGRQASTLLLEHLAIDKNQYRIGSSKIFFRAGVLAEMENLRDLQLSKIVVKIQAMMRGFLGRLKYKRQIEQFRAIKIIQRNARIYVVLREWSWWKLYSKVKPLLNVSRTDEELRKVEALAKEWEEKAKKEAEEKARIESLRLALEMEKKKIEEILLQEKNAAEDQQEILARTQKRELELNERLSDIIRELEERESQNSELQSASKNLKQEIASLSDQRNMDKEMIDRLEKDKAAKENRLAQIEKDLANEQTRIQKLESEKKNAEHQLAQAEDRLKNAGEDQNELAKQKSKLQATLLEVEQKLESEQQEKRKLDQARNLLDYELTQAKNAIEELTRAKNDLEILLKKRESEISNLNDNISRVTSEKDAVEKQGRELTLKLQATSENLETERDEKAKISKLKSKAEDEINELRQLMEQKGNEESKQGELRRLRDQEVTTLKSQVTSLQDEINDTRKKGHLAAEKLNSELDSLREELAKTTKSKQTVEAQLRDLQESHEKLEESLAKTERSKKSVDTEYDALKNKISELENTIFQIKSQNELLEKQALTLNLQKEEAENRASALDREKTSAMRNVSSLQEELEQEVSKRQNLENQKKRLTVDLQDLHARLNETEAASVENASKLQAKTAEHESLREKYTKEISERVGDLEEAKKRADRELSETKARLEEFERVGQNLERTKGRLNSEIEDLKLEIDREHNAAIKAERMLKQVESQLNTANLNIEAEQRKNEMVSSEVRKLQSNLDTANSVLDEKNIQINSLQKSKNDLDSELKALINEIGDGGKNVHELERTKRRLEAEIDDLKIQIEIQSNEKLAALDSKKVLEQQFSDYRKRVEVELSSKDATLEESRKMLMKEVNALGEQLDDALSAKNDLAKAKKKLEEQIESLGSQAESSAKGQSDLQKLKGKNEAVVRELNARIEEMRSTNINLQELCQRHEKKANSLQSEIERLELQLDGAERTRKQLEKQVNELDNELNAGEDSKANLMTLKSKLLAENQGFKRQVEELEDEMDAIKASKATSDKPAAIGASILEYEQKITAFEENKRALVAAQRLTKQELEDKIEEISTLNRAKKQMQSDLDQAKLALEKEIVAKGEEVAARRKLTTEFRELELRFEARLGKTTELEEALMVYRSKCDQTADKLEQAEQARLKSERGETLLRQQLKELQDSFSQTFNEKKAAEDRARQLEDQLVDLQDKADENSHAVADFVVAKKQLQEEIAMLKENHRAEIEERDKIEESSRKRIQKELKETVSDLEQEKTSNIALKESVRSLENELQSLNMKVDTEFRGSSVLKKEKDKLEGKVQELQQAVNDLSSLEKSRQSELTHVLNELRDVKGKNEEYFAVIQQLEKSKKAYEKRIEDLDSEFSMTMKEKSKVDHNMQQLGSEANDLREQLEDKTRDLESAQARMKYAEDHGRDVHLELSKERGINIELEKAKLVLEKSLKELNSKLYDLEATQLSRDTNTTRRLESRIDELTTQLESTQLEKAEQLKNVRKFERSIRELQLQLQEKDKLKTRFEEEQDKMEEKYKRMKSQIEELEASESDLQLAKRKAEREAADFREKALKYEREMERIRGRTATGVN